MAKEKKIIPLGQFKYGEISPQAAQSLSPKESPYALRKSHNCMVDLLSGIKCRRGLEYITDIEFVNTAIWVNEGEFVRAGALANAEFGKKVRISGKYLMTMETSKVTLFERVSGQWIEKERYSTSSELFDIHGNFYAYVDDNGDVYSYDIIGGIATPRAVLSLSGCYSLSVYNGTVCVRVTDTTGAVVVTDYSYNGISWSSSGTITLTVEGAYSEKITAVIKKGDFLACHREVQADSGYPYTNKVDVWHNNSGWSKIHTESSTLLQPYGNARFDINDIGIFVFGDPGYSYAKGRQRMYEWTGSALTLIKDMTGSARFDLFGAGVSVDQSDPKSILIDAKTGNIVLSDKTSGSWVDTELDGPIPTGIGDVTFLSNSFAYDEIVASPVNYSTQPKRIYDWLISIGISNYQKISCSGSWNSVQIYAVRARRTWQQVTDQYGQDQSGYYYEVWLYDNNDAIISPINSGQTMTYHTNGYVSPTFGYAPISKMNAQSTVVLTDIMQPNTDIDFWMPAAVDGNYVVSGDVNDIIDAIETGSITVFLYAIPELKVQLMILAHPSSDDTTIFQANQQNIHQIYGSPLLDDIAAAVGVTCEYLDYSQWGKYLLYIDKNQTDVFIADISADSQFVTLAAKINDAGADPTWGSDIPVSLDYHEGRFIFVSKTKYYGCSLETFDGGIGVPFRFKENKAAVLTGETVFTPSSAFTYAPLGGDDPGFQWIRSGRFVLSGSKRYIWILSDYNGNLSATNPNMHKLSSQGSANIKGLQTSGGLYYFQADEKTLMALGMTQDGAIAVPINIASAHFFEEYKPVKMVLTSGNESTIWILRSDGKVVSYQINNQDQLNAEGSWSLHDFGGEVLDIVQYNSPTESTLVVAIKRTSPYGDISVTCEKLTTKKINLDSFTSIGTASSYTHARFARQNVLMISGNIVEEFEADENGFVDFGDTYTDVYVGLKYDSYFMPRVYPDVHGKEKGRIISIAPIVEDTPAFMYGTDFDDLYSKTLIDDDTGEAYTGQVEELNVNSGAEYLPGFYIKNVPGAHFEFNAIYVGVE